MKKNSAFLLLFDLTLKRFSAFSQFSFEHFVHFFIHESYNILNLSKKSIVIHKYIQVKSAHYIQQSFMINAHGKFLKKQAYVFII